MNTSLAARTDMNVTDGACPPRASHLSSAPVTDGAALTFETVAALDPAITPTRLRPFEDVLLRVIDGVVRLTVNGAEQLLGVGGEAIVPAGAPHTITAVAREARYVMGMRTRLY
jgi:quercetin dioxygenase-like cupin family protein